jgi:hypothetical protein
MRWYYYASALGPQRTVRMEAFACYEKLNTMEPQSLDGWLDHADLLMQLKGPEAALPEVARKARWCTN